LFETDLVSEIDAALDTVNQDELETVERASERIQKAIIESPIPKDIQKSIVSAHNTLDAQFVAV